MEKLSITEKDIDWFYDVAARSAAMCNEGKACPTPIYCGCPFKHVLNMPEDCKRTTVSQWIILLMKLSKLEVESPGRVQIPNLNPAFY